MKLNIVLLTSFIAISNAQWYWTSWIDRDDPSGDEDNELRSGLYSPPCVDDATPLAAECRAVHSKVSSELTGQRFQHSCGTNGLVCRNDENSPDCVDYEVRYKCPGYSPTEDTFNLAVFWTEGKASDCDFVRCRTVNGGVEECKELCLASDECNVFNFCPRGADCDAVNRCCTRHCSNIEWPQLTSRWKGWNVYVKKPRGFGCDSCIASTGSQDCYDDDHYCSDCTPDPHSYHCPAGEEECVGQYCQTKCDSCFAPYESPNECIAMRDIAVNCDRCFAMRTLEYCPAEYGCIGHICATQTEEEGKEAKVFGFWKMRLADYSHLENTFTFEREKTVDWSVGVEETDIESFEDSATSSHSVQASTAAEIYGLEIEAAYEYNNDHQRTHVFESEVSTMTERTTSISETEQVTYVVPAYTQIAVWYWNSYVINSDYTWANFGTLEGARTHSGCGYDLPPNCLPGRCAAGDPNCWSCTEQQYMIDPDFEWPCTSGACKFLPIIDSACPQNAVSLPVCSSRMEKGSLCKAYIAPSTMDAGEHWEIENCGRDLHVFEYVCPPPSGWCRDEEMAFCSCEKCPQGECIRDRQGNCRIFEDGYHCSLGSAGAYCQYPPCFEESGQKLFTWIGSGANRKTDFCYDNPIEKGACYMNLCGCPGAYLEPWCDHMQQEPLVHSEWCQIEENCDRCAGTWCSGSTVPSGAFASPSVHCGAIPESCAEHIEWAHTHGKYQYEDWYPGFEEVTGASLNEGSYQDMAQYFYCKEIQSEDCVGLEPQCLNGDSRSCSSESDFTAEGIWYSQPHHDDPHHDGDDNEPRSHAGPNGDGDVCEGEEPIDIRCVTSTGVHGVMTTADFSCSIEHGFYCKASDNHGKCPYDFYVMYKCPEKIEITGESSQEATCETIKNDHSFCGSQMEYDPSTRNVRCHSTPCDRNDRSKCCMPR